MKLGIISDIHSNGFALEQVLEALRDRGVQRILCAGDIVGYGSQPNRTIRLLKIGDVECIIGNHDEGAVNGTPSDFNVYAKRALDWNRRNLEEEYLDYLGGLDYYLRENIDGSEVFMVHGSPKNPLSAYVHAKDADSEFLSFSFESPPDILIMGQTHRPFTKQINETLVVNPGSVGQPRDGDPRASCAIIDLDTEDVEIVRVDYDQQKAADDILEYLPKPLAERVLSGK